MEVCVPYQNVPLLLDHDEVHAPVLMLSHKCVRNEVQEDVGEKSACLGEGRAVCVRDHASLRQRRNAYRESGHRV